MAFTKAYKFDDLTRYRQEQIKKKYNHETIKLLLFDKNGNIIFIEKTQEVTQ